jgi:hypothetical protein
MLSDARIPSTWAEFPWPAWIPEETRKEIERFWNPEAGRAPQDWLLACADRYNHHPALGARVECQSLSQSRLPLMRGRWVPAWNNIGRVVLDDGTVGMSSTCGIRLLEEAPDAE